jgi:hypothetical protein
MNTNRFGLTPDEVEDEAKHFYAIGTLRLRAMADEISEIAPTADSKFVLELLQVQLVDVHQLIVCQTIDGMDDSGTYSDGTPVSIVVGPPSSRGWSAPDDVDVCGIPWLPNCTGDDDYDFDWDGPIPPGCEVMVVTPPHQRKSNARARTTP